MAAATVMWPSHNGGSVRPFGYAYNATITNGQEIVIGVPTDVHQVGIQVVAGSGASYFVYTSMSDIETVTANTDNIWFDLFGDGETAQTISQQGSFDGAITAIKVVSAAGSHTVDIELRRV